MGVGRRGGIGVNGAVSSGGWGGQGTSGELGKGWHALLVDSNLATTTALPRACSSEAPMLSVQT